MAIPITEQIRLYRNEPILTRDSVATIADRNNIPVEERFNGIKTIVRSEGKRYEIIYSGNFNSLSTAAKNAFLADNNNWKEVVGNAALDFKEDKANKGVANGYAPLGADTKIPLQFFPDSVLGALEYKGVWSATTNTAPHGSPENGWYYKVNVAGQTTFTGSTIEWAIGDWIIYNGTTWDRVANADKVISVNGQEGEVIINDSNLEHEPAVSIPTWISSVYTAGKAAFKGVFDAIITRIGIMDTQLTDIEDKLDTIEEGANNYTPPDYYGDVEILETGETIINDGVVGNAQLESMPANTFKMAITAGQPINATLAQVKAALSLPNDTVADLAAKQAAIDSLLQLVASDNFNLDTIQEIVDFIEANRTDLDTYISALENKVDKEVGKALILLTDIAKLAGIEDGATADQTATEIRDLLITLSGANRLPHTAIAGLENLESGIQSIQVGSNMTINNSDPKHPILNSIPETGESIANKYEAYLDVKRFTTALKAKVDSIITNGDGTLFKSNDGTYKVVSALPEQAGQGGKFAKTNGTVVSWEQIGIADILDLAAQLSGKESTSNKNIAGGYAGIDLSTGKILPALLPDSITESIEYMGTWDATSGVAPSVSPTKGQYWRVSVVGDTDLDGFDDWGLNDWAISNGTTWDQIKNSERFTSINGQTSGAVTINDNTIDHEPASIPTWIASVYTNGKAKIRSVLDAISSQIATMKSKLDNIQAEATKNETNANLRKRDTHTGYDPISSIEGFDTAENSTIPFKNEAGEGVWAPYRISKPFSKIQADGTITYWDSPEAALMDSYDNGRTDDVEVVTFYKNYGNLNVPVMGPKTINLNGFSVGDIQLMPDTPGLYPNIVGNGMIRGSLDIVNGDYELIVNLLNPDGGGVNVSVATFNIYGDVISRDIALQGEDLSGNVYGHVISLEAEAISTSSALQLTVHGDVISHAETTSAVYLGSATSGGKLKVYGNIALDNPLSNKPVIDVTEQVDIGVTGGILNEGTGYAVGQSVFNGLQKNIKFLGRKVMQGGIQDAYTNTPTNIVVTSIGDENSGYTRDIEFEVVEPYTFKAVEDMVITAIETEGAQEVTLTGYTIGDLLSRYDTFQIDVNMPGLVTVRANYTLNESGLPFTLA